MASLIRRLCREVYAALQAYGAIYMSGPWVPPGAGPSGKGPAGRELAGPPTAHPERLCPEVALTPVERALNRQLKAGS
ncbi:DUF6059 family protein [Streptomyces atriruber]|uniref:DUF6059 family protein n=1 Tax=Streptomyces atriruber TaxID=545121 RepID=UPI0006E326EC|nr:DUF6059 family protein [Streptomyces atriruber]